MMNNEIEIFDKLENVKEVEILFEGLCLSQKDKKKSQSEKQTVDERGILEINNETDLTLLSSNDTLSTQLKQLSISCTALTEIPPEICRLKYLTALDLSNNHLESLPNAIGNLCNLVTLQLSRNKLHCLPKSLKSLQQLNCLDVSHNEFAEVPFVLYYGLRALKLLDLSHNRIEIFNDPPACVNKLAVLGLSSNALKKLPAWIFSSSCRLQVLCVSGNEMQFDSEPTGFYGCGVFRSLQFLSMENCNCSTANIHIVSALRNLQVLQLGNKAFSAAEKVGQNYFGNFTMNGFKDLTCIRSLYLQSVQLATLPSDFSCLKSITLLDLSDNLLSWLPESFCDLTSLRTLYLTSNRLFFLPKNFANLLNLQQLHLSCNALYEIPEDFHKLDSLEFADFYDNKIEKINDVFKCKTLKGIDLESNCLELTVSEWSDEVRKRYDCLKDSFRQCFALSDSRGDCQRPSPYDKAAAAKSGSHTYSTKSTGSSIENEQGSDLEDAQEDVGASCHGNEPVEEDWERTSCSGEDELFDPNETTARRPSSAAWSAEFHRNYCPANAHVPSVMSTYIRNFKSTLKKETVEEGQFDSD